MRIESGQMIAGMPALRARKIVRLLAWGDAGAPFVAESLGVSEERARRLLSALARAGFLERSADPWRRAHGQDWSTTTQGQALAMASARRPIHRATADRLLSGVLARARSLESGEHPYAFRVAELYVYGSYLRDVDRLGDLDMAVTWRPRFADREAQREYLRERRTVARHAGRLFSNLGQEMLWPEDEVRRFLRGGSPTISLQVLETPERRAWLMERPHRLLYSFVSVPELAAPTNPLEREPVAHGRSRP